MARVYEFLFMAYILYLVSRAHLHYSPYLITYIYVTAGDERVRIIKHVYKAHAAVCVDGHSNVASFFCCDVLRWITHSRATHSSRFWLISRTRLHAVAVKDLQGYVTWKLNVTYNICASQCLFWIMRTTSFRQYLCYPLERTAAPSDHIDVTYSLSACDKFKSPLLLAVKSFHPNNISNVKPIHKSIMECTWIQQTNFTCYVIHPVKSILERNDWAQSNHMMSWWYGKLTNIYCILIQSK
jgi:hypothetical protein